MNRQLELHDVGSGGALTQSHMEAWTERHGRRSMAEDPILKNLEFLAKEIAFYTEGNRSN